MSQIIRLLLDKPWLFLVVIVASLVLGLIFENFQYKSRISEFLTSCCMYSVIGSFVLGIIFFLFFSSAAQRPVSSNEWVEIYENDLNARVKLYFQDYSGHYNSAFAGGHYENLKDLSETATRKKTVRNIQLTVEKDHNEIQKIVVLDKDNLIQNYDDLNNVKIAKLEYRKIDGLARELFGIYGSPQAFDEIGEIRITLESSEDKELQKVFGQ